MNLEQMQSLDFVRDAAQGAENKGIFGYNEWWPYPQHFWEDYREPFYYIKVKRQFLTPEQIAWFKEEWLFSNFSNDAGDRIWIVPKLFKTGVNTFFHVTPSKNWSSIQAKGLMSGNRSGQSTTGDKGKVGRDYLHVSLSLDAAKYWCALLDEKEPVASWTIIQFSLDDPAIKVFRDPHSETGYIIDTEIVDPRLLVPIVLDYSPTPVPLSGC